MLTKQIVASCAGSIITTVALNPVNVMKVFLQSQRHQHQSGVSAGFRQILRERGVRGFWAGTSSGLAMSVPNTVLYMSTYEAFKASLQPFAHSPTQQLLYTGTRPMLASRLCSCLSIAGAAGFLARMVAVSLLSPLELIRTLQSAGRAESIASTARRIAADGGGVLSLYRGWLPTILRDCPYSAIYWFSFEFVRPIYSRSLASSSDAGSGPTPLATFLSGASSGMVAAFVTHPFDVLKTKRQLAVERVSLLSIFRVEGCVGIFRGLSLRLLTVIPASAIMITVYDAIKNVSLA